jgi:hypothetical protein
MYVSNVLRKHRTGSLMTALSLVSTIVQTQGTQEASQDDENRSVFAQHVTYIHHACLSSSLLPAPRTAPTCFVVCLWYHVAGGSFTPETVQQLSQLLPEAELVMRCTKVRALLV